MVAILGAGIMGSSVALLLADRNIRSVLIDAAPVPFNGASRWNEGKIHLGYLYGADPSLATARRLIPGGLKFKTLIERILARPLRENEVTDHNDTFLISRRSVVSADAAFAIAQRIAELTLGYADASEYFVPLTDNQPRRLTRRELEGRYDCSDIVAGYEVPERSVSTRLVADSYLDALASCALIERAMNHRVRSVSKSSAGAGRWMVETVTHAGTKETWGPFDAVVNALWEGRGEVDASVEVVHSATWTHRFRVSLFARTIAPIDLKSTVIAVGPFGDLKNYDGRSLYLSWYESGLLASGHELRPPEVVPLRAADEARIADATLDNLGMIVPQLRSLRAQIESLEVRGGWVYASGRGELNSATSGLHRRDQIGVVSKDGYFSVDTGKYSMAPWIAAQVVEAVANRQAI
jgi:glycine/D-amino acid oxidase-like deaminating enzyme